MFNYIDNKLILILLQERKIDHVKVVRRPPFLNGLNFNANFTCNNLIIQYMLLIIRKLLSLQAYFEMENN